MPMVYDGDAWTWVKGADAGARTSALERAESPSILLGQPRTEYPIEDNFELPVRRLTGDGFGDHAKIKRADTVPYDPEPSAYDPYPVTQDDSRSTNWPEDHLARVIRAREIAHKLAKRAKKQGVHGVIAEATSLVQSNLGASSFGINGPPSNILGQSIGGSLAGRSFAPSDSMSTVSGSSSRSKLKARKEERKEEKREAKEMKKLARSQTQPIPEHAVLSPQRSYPAQPSYAMQQWYQSTDFPPPPPPVPALPSNGLSQTPSSPQSPQNGQPQQFEQVQQPMRHAPPIPEGEPPPYTG